MGSRKQSVALGNWEGRVGAASCPGIVTWGREQRWHVSRQRGQAPRVRACIDVVASACVAAAGTSVNGDGPAPGPRPGMPTVVGTSTGRPTWPESHGGHWGWQPGEERSGKG